MRVAAVNWQSPESESRALSFFIFGSPHAAVLLLSMSGLAPLTVHPLK